MKNKIFKFINIITISALLVGCTNSAIKEEENNTYEVVSMEEASTTPYGKYPTTIEYTIANMTGLNNSNMPIGDTYEDNAYTRFLKEMLNIQNINVIEEEEGYNNSVQMLISSKNIPDVMIVESLEDLEYLVENDMIEDLTVAYENCTSARIKEMYESYDSSILAKVTFDDKIYAMPGTNINDGPNLFWVRQDWLDKLGLGAPTTISDVENIIKAFITEDPGDNGENNTVGLMIDPSITGESGYSSEYLLDVIFACFDSYPKQWIEKDGEVIYGSVDSSSKEALSYIQKLYQDKVIDNDFLFRSTNNIIETIVDGKCGSFFGPWWAPNNPLIDAIKADGNATWVPYLIETNDQGTTSYHSQNPSDKYVVVRKGFEHPELIFKQISVIFDYLRYDNTDAKEINEYFRLNVDPTARPISINVDYSDALDICHNNILDILEKITTNESLTALDYSYASAIEDHQNNSKLNKEENWAAYASRIQAVSLLKENKLNKVNSLFFGSTETMSKSWWKLQSLEKEVYLKIITGEASISTFDTFVEEWNNQGGKIITKEVNEKINK